MNKLETFVYNRVKSNYLIKNCIRNIYQGFYDIFPKKESFFSEKPIICENSFFGFHDSNPFSKDGSKHLAYKLQIPLRMPERGDALEIGYWSGQRFEKWNSIAKTYAWNYHKGSRLQWLSENQCIYNMVEDGTLCSEIADLTDGTKRRLSWPIDSVSPDGRMATTFSYERLQAMMPGYGYLYGDVDSFMHEDLPTQSGLYLIDVNKNERKMLVDLKSLSEFHYEPTMADCTHFVTHTEFSPDNRYVAFLHRWYRGTHRKTRLIVYDLENNQMYQSPTSGMVSHFVWNQQNGIVAYCRIDNVDSHVYFSSPEMTEWKRCGYPRLNSDGHQHFLNNDVFLADTYPDKKRFCKLYKVDRCTDEVEMLANVYSPKQFVSPDEQHHWKCDLHPRCDADGRYVSFDSVHTGVRSLCIMPISNKS